jgi:two-component system sensor histidine kinase/response regulator
MYLNFDFLSFVDLPGSQPLLVGTFRSDLVILSVAIAICGAWAGLACLRRAESIVEERPGATRLWTTAGGIGFGGSIWGMHFVGMLAFSLPCGISYDVLTTSLSILPGILASLVALIVISRTELGLHWRLTVGSILMGAGIGTMHYIGMAAMRLPAFLLYDPDKVAISIVAAIVLAYVALALVEYGRQRKTHSRVRQLFAAIVLGSAVASMHYIAMQAAVFYPALEPTDTAGQLSQGVLALFVGLGAVTLAGTVTAASFAARLNEAARYLAEEVEQRRNAEYAARADEAWLRAVFDTAVEAIIVINQTGIIQRWSRSAQRILGYTDKEAIGQNISMITYGILKEEHDNYLHRYKETGVASIIGVGREVMGRRKDGSSVPLELSVGEAQVDGEFFYTGVLRDISEKKEIEQELLEATRAKEANEIKSNFLAHMSHEMRTPLNAILGFSDLMRGETFGPLNETYVSYSNDIFSSGSHLLNLVNALLDLSKIEQNRLYIELGDVKLRSTIDDSVNMLREQAREKELNISVLIDNDLPETIRSDRGKLHQTLINLISNAVKYTPRGGRVSVRAWPNCDGVEIVIEDTGIGMSGEEIELAMKPFGQIKNAFTADLAGTGLGLPIVVEFAALLNSQLKITSQKGEGTCVSIILPLTLEIDSTEGRFNAS